MRARAGGTGKLSTSAMLHVEGHTADRFHCHCLPLSEIDSADGLTTSCAPAQPTHAARVTKVAQHCHSSPLPAAALLWSGQHGQTAPMSHSPC